MHAHAETTTKCCLADRYSHSAEEAARRSELQIFEPGKMLRSGNFLLNAGALDDLGTGRPDVSGLVA